MDFIVHSRFADAVRTVVRASLVRRRMPDRHQRPIGCPESGLWSADPESLVPAAVQQSGGPDAVQLQKPDCT